MVPRIKIYGRSCLDSCQRVQLSFRTGTKVTLSLLDQRPMSPIRPSYLRPIYTYISGGTIGYAIIELHQFSDTSASIRDITMRQTEHPSLSWILTTLKLTRFFAKEEALRRLSSKGEGCFRENVLRAQFRCELSCLNEKSFFDFY